MATGNRIDAGIRFTADIAAAVRDVKALRAEVNALKSAGAGGAGAGAGASASTETTAAMQAVQALSAERSKAAREAQAAARATSTAERQAAKEAVDAQRAAAAEKRRIDKESTAAALAERQRLAKAERDAATERNAELKKSRQDTAKTAQLAPQVTDIVTGLAGGQNPLLVAIQQGGQLRDVFGGLGNAGRALMGIFTPLRLMVGGLAAVFGGLALAAKQGYDEQQQLTRGLAATGNTAATTAGEVGQMARQIAAGQGIAVGSVRDTLAVLATSGQFTERNLATAGKAATLFARLTSQSGEEVARSFGDIKSGVGDFANKLARDYNILSAAQLAQIRAAEASGDKNEAVRLTMEGLAQTSEERLLPTIGLLEKGWNAAAAAVSGFWDGLKKIGADTTLEETLADLRKQAGNPYPAGSEMAAQWQRDAKPLLDKIAATEAQIEQRKAAARAKAAQTEKDAEAKAKQSAGYQSAVAGLGTAEAAKLLAQQQAVLDQRAALAKRANEAGLSSALAYNLEMNAIEQQRLQAQAANVRRQIEIEKARVPATPEETMGQEARLKQLQAQLASVNGQIAVKEIEARSLVDANNLTGAQKSALAWEAAWTSAAGHIRQLTADNQAYDVAAIADAGERAAAAVAAQVAVVNAQLKEARSKLKAQTDPENTGISPAMRQEAQRQLDELEAQAKRRVDAITQQASFDAYARALAEQKQALDVLLAAIELEGSAVVDSEARKAAAIDAALPKLREYVALMKAAATTQDQKNEAGGAANAVNGLVQQVDKLKPIKDTAAQGLGQMFADVVSGAKSATDAIREFTANFARYMLELIAKKLAEQLVNDAMKALGSMGSGGGGGDGTGSWVAMAAKAFGLFHSGGVVGSGVGSGVSSMSRVLSPAIFGLAERYHSGGIAGLRADEVPAVLRRGEEVLTESDPRHRANGGGMGIGGDLNISVQVSGATGGEGQQNASAENLVRMIKGVVAEWAAQEMRPNGMLASRNR